MVSLSGWRLWYSLLLLLSIWLAFSNGKEDTVTEEMFLSPLAPDTFLVQWQTNIRSSFDQAGHYSFFPKALGQLIHQYSVHELHLSFSSGRWSEDWGPSLVSSPVGAELWARLDTNSSSLWNGLTHALSGVFCSSLNFMDEKHTIHPSASFPQRFRTEAFSPLLYYASLPREAVCTENLTPWSKLLPCRAQAGLASLIEPLHLANSKFRSIQTQVFRICHEGNCDRPEYQLVQTLTAVLSLPESKQEKGWDLAELLGRPLGPLCNSISSSILYLDIGKGIWRPNLEPKNAQERLPLSLFAGSLQAFEHEELLLQPLSLSQQSPSESVIRRVQDITIHRYISGSQGWDQQKLIVDIRNNGPVPVMARYVDSLPSFIQPSYHTFEAVSLGDRLLDLSQVQWEIQPGEDQRSAGIQVHMQLPAGAGVSIRLNWRKVFLHYASYPPDPHRGFHIPSGLLVLSPYQTQQHPCFSNNTHLPFVTSLLCSNRVTYQYTEALLLTLPTPDFSMPYNVITLTGAAIGLFFASVFKIVTRRGKDILPQQGRMILRLFGSK